MLSNPQFLQLLLLARLNQPAHMAAKADVLLGLKADHRTHTTWYCNPSWRMKVSKASVSVGLPQGSSGAACRGSGKADLDAKSAGHILDFLANWLAEGRGHQQARNCERGPAPSCLR